MAHARMGNEAEAREYCDRAVRWTCENRYGDCELHFFDDEAAAIPPLDAPRMRVRVRDQAGPDEKKMPTDPHDPTALKHL
jgi:hypothetical protein